MGPSFWLTLCAQRQQIFEKVDGLSGRQCRPPVPGLGLSDGCRSMNLSGELEFGEYFQGGPRGENHPKLFMRTCLSRTDRMFGIRLSDVCCRLVCLDIWISGSATGRLSTCVSHLVAQARTWLSFWFGLIIPRRISKFLPCPASRR